MGQLLLKLKLKIARLPKTINIIITSI